MGSVVVISPGEEPNENGRMVDVTIEVLESLNDACLEFIEQMGLSDEFSAYLDRRNTSYKN